MKPNPDPIMSQINVLKRLFKRLDGGTRLLPPGRKGGHRNANQLACTLRIAVSIGAALAFLGCDKNQKPASTPEPKVEGERITMLKDSPALTSLTIRSRSAPLVSYTETGTSAENARAVAAQAGLTPRQYSSGARCGNGPASRKSAVRLS